MGKVAIVTGDVMSGLPWLC